MAIPATSQELVECIAKSGVIDPLRLEEQLRGLRADAPLPEAPRPLADLLVRRGLLTAFQAEQFLQGRWRNFIIKDKYKLMERLGQGGMGSVFLCEHTTMRHAVALKFLPAEHANDPSMLERFRREARAAAQLKHPNIVQTYDIDQAGNQHFLVMEYVFGRSLQDLVRKVGPLEPVRAAHYIRQAALGLQHAHERGLVHRDIKPGNLLVDAEGTVKVLDLGLARFFHDNQDHLTKQFDNDAILGTADYLAPEQAVDSHNADIRSDIYSLGITFYYLLAGTSPFKEGTTAQKLIWHQVCQPRPIRELRPDMPEAMTAVLDKMFAKNPADRYQVPADVAEALLPWTQTAIDPPSESELPRLSAAARGICLGEASTKMPRPDSISNAPTRVSPSRHPGPPTPTPQTPGSPTMAPKAAASGNGQGDQTGQITESPLAAGPTSRSGEPNRTGDTAGTARLAAPTPRSRFWLYGGVAAAALVAAGVVALVLLWPMLTRTPETTRDLPGPAVVPPPPTADQVAIQFDKGIYRVKTPTYEAVIEPDGCLTSLHLGGKEWLRSGGGSTARGCYFFNHDKWEGILKLPNVTQPAGNLVTAQGEKAAIQYEFAADSLRWRVTNALNAPLHFFIVFDKSVVTAVQNDKDEWAASPAGPLPAGKPWTTTTWYGGRSKLSVSRSDRIWGPYEERGQVVEFALKPQETREVVLRIGTASDAEVAKAAALTATPPLVPMPPRPVVPSPLPPDPAVSITRENKARRIQTPKYEALVADDGCLTNLRLGGVDFFKPGVAISRGAYFHQKISLKLPDMQQPAANVITAQGPEASERFEFGPDLLVLQVTNATGAPMSYFIVFDPAVTTVKNDKGEEAPTPVVKDWPTTSWTAEKTRLAIYGGNRIWGPWTDRYQVWEASLAPNETRQLILKVEAAPPLPDLAVQSPLNWQVCQRRTKVEGEVPLRGRVRPECDRLETRLTGKSLQGPLPDKWQPVALQPRTRTFEATLAAPAGGWYQLELRALQGAKVVAQAVVDHVGVGEVFVIAGQSNATNCGSEKTQPKSGLVSSFSGSSWQPADDPQPGVHDNTMGGSPWPAFGDALAAKYQVPIGIASTGHAGTSVNAWQPDGELFNWMIERMRQLGPHGFRAVLWHQGESDINMPADDYTRRLTAIIQRSRKAAGWEVPWFVAQVSYQNPYNKMFASVRSAQKKLWETGVALEGPDTDKLMGDNRDNNGQGIHFSTKGLHAHGQLWADKVGVYLDKVLKDK